MGFHLRQRLFFGALVPESAVRSFIPNWENDWERFDFYGQYGVTDDVDVVRLYGNNSGFRYYLVADKTMYRPISDPPKSVEIEFLTLSWVRTTDECDAAIRSAAAKMGIDPTTIKPAWTLHSTLG